MIEGLLRAHERGREARMRWFARALSLLLVAAANGCGVQLGYAKLARKPSDFSPGVNVAGRVVRTRDSGLYVGGDAELTFRRGARVTHGFGSLGYRLLLHPFSLEIGTDMGLGQPVGAPWQGTGFYLGASASLLYRLHGGQDADYGYAPIGVLFDLVLQTRAGFWGRAYRDVGSPWCDGGAILALRVTGISDITTTTNREWRQP